MQFALQALPFSRHAENDAVFVSPGRSPMPLPGLLRRARPAPPRDAVRILRSEASSQGGRLLISGRMADVCAALNRLAVNEFACG